MGRKCWVGLAVLAVAAAVWSSCGGDDETKPSEVTAPAVVYAEGTAEMVVDAVSGGEITATAEVRGTDPFEVDVNILGATAGYQGYQYYLNWDPNVLALDDHRYLEPASLDLCATAAIFDDRVAAGCVRLEDVTMFAGSVGTISFHCASSGTSPLHLMTSEERPASFSGVLAPRGLIISTELTDASVTCLGP